MKSKPTYEDVLKAQDELEFQAMRQMILHYEYRGKPKLVPHGVVYDILKRQGKLHG